MIYKITMLNGKNIPTTSDKEILVKVSENFKGKDTQHMFSVTETTAKYGKGCSYSMNVWFVTHIEEACESFIVFQKPSENPFPFILTPLK